ncbi:hypothetical protein V8C35DRAFT_236790 [Trichoderma chlorosporum]
MSPGRHVHVERRLRVRFERENSCQHGWFGHCSPSTAILFPLDAVRPSALQQTNSTLRDALRTGIQTSTTAPVVKLRTVTVHDQPTAQPILSTTRLWQVPSYRAPLLGSVLVRLSLPDHGPRRLTWHLASPHLCASYLLCSKYLPLYGVQVSRSHLPAISSALCARIARPCALFLDCSSFD